MSQYSKYPKGKFNSISEVHPLSPLFLKKINPSGSTSYHIQVFVYDHHQKIIVEISEIVAKDLGKRLAKGSVSYSGIGTNMFGILESDFKTKYKKLTEIEFEGKKQSFKKEDSKFFEQDINNFLKNKENKLMFATLKEQNTSKLRMIK